MLKIINAQLYSLGQNFLDEVWDLNDLSIDPKDSRISPRSHGNQGVINEENFEEFEPTSVEEPVEEYSDDTPEFRREIPVGNELLGIPEDSKEVEYNNPQQLVYDGIDNKEVISFDYTNRHGRYAGIRTVEPHYTFVAKTTGNEVLVSFDRDQGDIRAFIIGNIHPYGVRYRDVQFNIKDLIMRGVF